MRRKRRKRRRLRVRWDIRLGGEGHRAGWMDVGSRPE